MAAAIPLLADHAVDQVSGGAPATTMSAPALWEEPLLRVHPSLHHPAVDPAECAGALQCGQLAKRNPGVVVIQVKQQDPRDTVVQTGGPLQKLHAIPIRQMQVGGHQRHLLAAASQLLQLGNSVGGRTCGQYSIVQPNRRSSADAVVRTSFGSPPTISNMGAGAVAGEAIVSDIHRRSAGFHGMPSVTGHVQWRRTSDVGTRLAPRSRKPPFGPSI